MAVQALGFGPTDARVAVQLECEHVFAENKSADVAEKHPGAKWLRP
jgi:hypothetical protein